MAGPRPELDVITATLCSPLPLSLPLSSLSYLLLRISFSFRFLPHTSGAHPYRYPRGTIQQDCIRRKSVEMASNILLHSLLCAPQTSAVEIKQ